MADAPPPLKRARRDSDASSMSTVRRTPASEDRASAALHRGSPAVMWCAAMRAWAVCSVTPAAAPGTTAAPIGCVCVTAMPHFSSLVAATLALQALQWERNIGALPSPSEDGTVSAPSLESRLDADAHAFVDATSMGAPLLLQPVRVDVSLALGAAHSGGVLSARLLDGKFRSLQASSLEATADNGVIKRASPVALPSAAGAGSGSHAASRPTPTAGFAASNGLKAKPLVRGPQGVAAAATSSSRAAPPIVAAPVAPMAPPPAAAAAAAAVAAGAASDAGASGFVFLGEAFSQRVSASAAADATATADRRPGVRGHGDMFDCRACSSMRKAAVIVESLTKKRALRQEELLAAAAAEFNATNVLPQVHVLDARQTAAASAAPASGSAGGGPRVTSGGSASGGAAAAASASVPRWIGAGPRVVVPVAYAPIDVSSIPLPTPRDLLSDDAFVVLGLPPFADAPSIKRRFRALALAFHSDKLQQRRQAAAAAGVAATADAAGYEDAFIRVSRAYDAIKRERGDGPGW